MSIFFIDYILDCYILVGYIQVVKFCCLYFWLVKFLVDNIIEWLYFWMIVFLDDSIFGWLYFWLVVFLGS